VLQATDSSLKSLVLALYDVAVHARRFQSRDPVDTASIRLLSTLQHAGPMRPSDLAGLHLLDLSTISRHLRGLEDEGYVQREADPDDGRAIRFVLTESGADALDAVVANRCAALGGVLENWPAADRDQLGELLRRLADDLSADAGCPAPKPQESK
jgi:DNA-binding MarR family transcriptional regulator